MRYIILYTFHVIGIKRESMKLSATATDEKLQLI
jgi:hypothetical protein